MRASKAGGGSVYRKGSGWRRFPLAALRVQRHRDFMTAKERYGRDFRGGRFRELHAWTGGCDCTLLAYPERRCLLSPARRVFRSRLFAQSLDFQAVFDGAVNRQVDDGGAGLAELGGELIHLPQ